MNKTKLLSLSLAAVLLMGTLSGCKTTTDFTPKDGSGAGTAATEFTFDYSEFLSPDGTIKNVKAESVVNPGTYSGISVPKSEVTVKPEDLQAQIDSLMEYFVTYEQLKEGTVAEDSTLNIDYVGSVDNVPFDGGSTNGTGAEVTIGVTQYIDGFLSQLVGHKVGETFDINVTFPTDYTNAELAGKDAVFNITINSLQGEKIYPELTDDFVKENLSEQAGYSTVQEMKDEFSKELAATQQQNYVWKTLMDNAEVKEIPQEVLDFAEGLILSYHNMTAQQYGIPLSDYLSAMELGTLEDFAETQKEEIESQAKTILVLLAIAEKEGIKSTEEDILEAVGTSDRAQLEEYYGLPYINYIVLTGKAEKLAMESAVVAA